PPPSKPMTAYNRSKFWKFLTKPRKSRLKFSIFSIRILSYNVICGTRIMMSQIQQEIDQNFKAFEKLLPELIKNHRGEYVLMRQKKPIEFFNTVQEAILYADKKFADRLFSIQRIKQKPEDLGWFSHVPLQGSV
ncbi:MAG: hypothetical protein ACPGRX_05535, partial [Bdellovibrionales bacterium]